MLKNLVKVICCVVLLIVTLASISFISTSENKEPESAVYSDDAVTILEHNSLLLNQVAEMLWNSPEVFRSIQEVGESYSQFSVDELLSDPTFQLYFTEKEIQLLQEVAVATPVVSVGMYFPMYGRAQAIRFGFNCSDQSQRVLCYIRSIDGVSDQSAADQVKTLLDYMTYEWVAYKSTNYPCWYVQIRSSAY